jgi:hypothetical protein
MRVVAAGARIVWAADHAPVEEVPARRATEAWLVARMGAVGRSLSMIEIDRRGRLLATPRVLARAVVWAGLGAASCALGVAGGMVYRVRGRRWLAYAGGLVRGALTPAGEPGRGSGRLSGAGG